MGGKYDVSQRSPSAEVVVPLRVHAGGAISISACSAHMPYADQLNAWFSHMARTSHTLVRTRRWEDALYVLWFSVDRWGGEVVGV